MGPITDECVCWSIRIWTMITNQCAPMGRLIWLTVLEVVELQHHLWKLLCFVIFSTNLTSDFSMKVETETGSKHEAQQEIISY